MCKVGFRISLLSDVLKRKRKLVAVLLLSNKYIVTCTVNVLWLFITELRVGLPCVIVVLNDHTDLLFVPSTTNLLFPLLKFSIIIFALMQQNLSLRFLTK